MNGHNLEYTGKSCFFTTSIVHSFVCQFCDIFIPFLVLDSRLFSTFLNAVVILSIAYHLHHVKNVCILNYTF